MQNKTIQIKYDKFLIKALKISRRANNAMNSYSNK